MIVEIKGVKMDVDLREAEQIETFRVGDKVKVLIKEYSDYKVYPGVIVGFANFKSLPSVIVAYLKFGYSTAEIIFAYINESEENKVEIVKAENYDIPINKESAIELLQREINKAEASLEDAKRKMQYFKDYFGLYFDEIK